MSFILRTEAKAPAPALKPQPVHSFLFPPGRTRDQTGRTRGQTYNHNLSTPLFARTFCLVLFQRRADHVSPADLADTDKSLP
jgi:hypothetical protein